LQNAVMPGGGAERFGNPHKFEIAPKRRPNFG
jgi:hypothetical protein